MSCLLLPANLESITIFSHSMFCTVNVYRGTVRPRPCVRVFRVRTAERERHFLRIGGVELHHRCRRRPRCRIRETAELTLVCIRKPIM